MNKQAKTFLQYVLIAVLVISIVGVGSVLSSNYWVFLGSDLGIRFNVSNVTTMNESLQQMINITINNTVPGVDSNITQVNITLWGNFNYTLNVQNTSLTNASGGGPVTFMNSSTVLSWTNKSWLVNGSGSGNTTSVQSFWFNISATKPGRYNMTIQMFSNNSDTVTNSTNLTISVNDTTAPVVGYTGETKANNYNLSEDWIFINVSVNDTNPYNITFALLNSSGGYINISNYSMGGDRTKNVTQNWTGLPDGRYMYNVTVRDDPTLTLGNANQIGNTSIRNITLDNAAPNVTFSCDDTSVTRGTNKMTCTCTAVDTYDTQPTVSHTTNPDTTVTGSFTTTCTATDHASNQATSTISYTVSSPGATSVGGGGGGGTTYTKTIVEDSKEFSEIGTITKSVQSKQQIRIKVDGKKHNIGVVELTASTAKIEIYSTLQTATLSVGDTKKFDLTEDGYYDLSVTLNKIESDKADLTLSSIKEQKAAETEAEQAVEEPVAEPTIEGEVLAIEGKNTWIWIIVIVIVVLILIGIGYGIKKKRE